MSRRFVYYGAGRSAGLLLDLYPATVAYSLRKLRTTYTGSAIRVRRSSDNTELDIGFVGVDLDTTSLLSFVGVGNGFITTWYDQQGSNNLTQTTAGSQPQIVSTGVLITRGGNPACKFDGSNDFLIKSSQVVNVTDVSFFSVANNDLNESIGCISSCRSSFETIRIFIERKAALKRAMLVSVSNITYATEMSQFRTTGDPILYSNIIDASKNMSTFDNSNAGVGDTYIGNISTPILQLGRQTTGLSHLNGTIQEFIGYNTNQSANRISIETNINNYYGIY